MNRAIPRARSTSLTAALACRKKFLRGEEWRRNEIAALWFAGSGEACNPGCRWQNLRSVGNRSRSGWKCFASRVDSQTTEPRSLTLARDSRTPTNRALRGECGKVHLYRLELCG